jgi:hypothetical protein
MQIKLDLETWSLLILSLRNNGDNFGELNFDMRVAGEEDWRETINAKSESYFSNPFTQFKIQIGTELYGMINSLEFETGAIPYFIQPETLLSHFYSKYYEEIFLFRLS